MAEYIALCAKRQCQRWQAPFSRRACLCQRRRSRGRMPFLIFQAVLLLLCCIRYLFFRIDKKTDGMLLKHAVRHYRDKVMFDCRPAYLAMIFSTFEPVRRM